MEMYYFRSRSKPSSSLTDSFRPTHSSSSIRRAALAKLAVLATRFPEQDDGENSDVDRLTRAYLRPQIQSAGFLDGVFKGRTLTSCVPMVCGAWLKALRLLRCSSITALLLQHRI